MRKARSYIFLALLAALFIEILIIFPNRVNHESIDDVPAVAKSEDGTESETEPESEKQDPIEYEQLMRGVHLVESQKGSRDWELFSSETQSGESPNAWRLKKVRTLFYTDEKVEFTVIGDEGVVDAQRNIDIHGRVITTSANQYTFQTQDVRYDAKDRMIHSSSAVEMRGQKDSDGDEFKVTGKGMRLAVDTGLMFIQSDVKAEKRLKNGQWMRLVADSAELSGRNKDVRFIGNVLMNYGAFKLEGAEVKFVPSEKGNFLSNVQFSGGVKLTDADKFATSEKLNFDLINNRLALSGRPKVYQNGDEISGDQIIFLDGGKKVKVERVRASSAAPLGQDKK